MMMMALAMAMLASRLDTLDHLRLILGVTFIPKRFICRTFEHFVKTFATKTSN